MFSDDRTMRMARQVVAVIPEKRVSPTEPVSPLPAVKEGCRLDVSSSLGSPLVVRPEALVDHVAAWTRFMSSQRQRTRWRRRLLQPAKSLVSS